MCAAVRVCVFSYVCVLNWCVCLRACLRMQNDKTNYPAVTQHTSQSTDKPCNYTRTSTWEPPVPSHNKPDRQPNDTLIEMEPTRYKSKPNQKRSVTAAHTHTPTQQLVSKHTCTIE
eukprot:GDKI01009366.1.p1 GENE.GDKI01009366.1~~GDKI01009366.1.p1  ORF type:complete len:116 (+),score=36.17 GDKI01009366.1:64-411(+)